MHCQRNVLFDLILFCMERMLQADCFTEQVSMFYVHTILNNISFVHSQTTCRINGDEYVKENENLYK
jgi:hypothetical protein